MDMWTGVAIEYRNRLLVHFAVAPFLPLCLISFPFPFPFLFPSHFMLPFVFYGSPYLRLDCAAPVLRFLLLFVSILEWFHVDLCFVSRDLFTVTAASPGSHSSSHLISPLLLII